MLLNGNQAVGYGALAAGVRLYAGYPMSPATGIMEYLAGKQRDFDLVVEQAEDEIAAVNICLGAAYAGVRAMTATSGGGFALMVEGLGYSAMAELPLVIVVCQRPGPGTGFPTRTEQGELLYALNASQDEFPRFVLAPGTAEQACYATVRAFELANRYHVPAIVLSDQHLADSTVTIRGFDRARLTATDDFAEDEVDGPAPFTYRRYSTTEEGVSQRIQPGYPEQLVRVMGSEHDESGLPTEDATNRVRMQDRRMGKLAAMRREMDGIEVHPDDGERDVVVCFGSTYGAVREAVDLLQSDGVRLGVVHLQEVSPFPREQVVARLGHVRRIIAVEQNATGQFTRLLARETRIEADEQVLKQDGRPFLGSRLAAALRELL
jgi:2-oxoglutarate ferredoxin oxidoreductase subunit alpha